MSVSGWIGVDLDGTLAEYHCWKGIEHIGKPIDPMMARVRNWLRDGVTVKIVTARATVPECIPHFHAWLKQHGLPELEVTNAKDFAMIEVWDDRCVEVKMNTGIPVNPKRRKP